MNKYLVFALMCAVLISLSVTGFSQEETAEDVEYSYGTVVKVDNPRNEIVVSEYDYDNASETDVTYSVDNNTKFEEVTSLKEIAAGDDVDIEYVTGKDGKKTATYISVYKAEPDIE